MLFRSTGASTSVAGASGTSAVGSGLLPSGVNSISLPCVSCTASVLSPGSITAGLGSLNAVAWSCPGVDEKIFFATSILCWSKAEATLSLNASLKASPAYAFAPLPRLSINDFTFSVIIVLHYLLTVQL